MDLQFQKLKSALPIEVTAAYLAAKQVVDHARVDQNGDPIALGENFMIMLIVLFVLLILNAYIMHRAKTGISMLLFSALVFLLWAINIDIIRWEDPINSTFGLSPSGGGAKILLGVLAALISVVASLFAMPPKSNKDVVNG